ncbi:MAG: hypothetical protein OXU39_03230 [Gemmatimonadota bacterium]|nr:hypothetical protein [Gemmatimonadota bacterium]MDE3005084.1 hypothetical protein [Gemmatimonadota bacterium]
MTVVTCRPNRVAFAALCFSLFFSPQSARAQAMERDTVDVFFLGNSYVYYNNLADQLARISESLPGPVLRTSHHLHGGYSLRRHLEDGHLPSVLEASGPDGENWDVVIVQEQSRLGVPYADEEAGVLGDPTSFLQSVAEVGDIVSENGAAMLLYMTWAKEAFPDQTAALARAYTEAGVQNDAAVAPVGLAWDHVRSERPDILLFHPDGSHPSPAGTYLAACIFYAELTGQPPLGASVELYGFEMQTPGVIVSDDPIPLVRLDPEMATYIQDVAWQLTRRSPPQG